MKIFLISFFSFVFSGCSSVSKEAIDIASLEYILTKDGIELPVWIRGDNPKKVIIFIHGGPGSGANLVDTYSFFHDLSKQYTMVFWNQRGVWGTKGKVDYSTITLPYLVEDTAHSL